MFEYYTLKITATSVKVQWVLNVDILIGLTVDYLSPIQAHSVYP